MLEGTKWKTPLRIIISVLKTLERNSPKDALNVLGVPEYGS